MGSSTKYRCVKVLEVRFRDTDAFGHVNNAVYLSYLEAARVQYWREAFGVSDFTKADFIIANVHIDYRTPAFVGETLKIFCRVSRLGRKSFDFEYEIRDTKSNRLVAEATSTQVMYDCKKNKSKAMSTKTRKAFAQYERRAL